LVLLFCLTPACSTKYDHSVAVASCPGLTLEVVERYRRQGFSGWTGNSRFVIRVRKDGVRQRSREIDVTPIDTVDLSALERLQPDGARWHALAPHDQASRRVFVAPGEFTVAEYDVIASCLERHAAGINRGFATPRAPTEYFAGEAFRERRAGLKSVAYREAD